MQIFVHRDGTNIGPYSEAEIRSRIADGSLSPSDLGWTEGMSDWVSLSSFAAFKEASPLNRPQRRFFGEPTGSIDQKSLGAYARSTLQPDETPLHRTVIHPIVMVVGFVTGGLLLLFSLPPILLSSIHGYYGSLLFLLAPIAIALPGWIAFKTSELLITDRRVIIKIGFLQRRTLEMFISKIESVAVRQPLVGRMFDYGTVIIRGTGGSAEYFPMIAAPIEFRNAIQRVQSASDRR